MPNTYVAIQSTTLGSATASVTFSSIPQTYTDLVIRWSGRTDDVGSVQSTATIKINGTALSQSSWTELRGDGSGAFSARSSALGVSWQTRYTDGPAATSNTFSSNEAYIPNYAGSTNKVASTFNAQENNSATASLTTHANLLANTAAITSIEIIPGAGNFVAGSTFHLYGIKNT